MNSTTGSVESPPVKALKILVVDDNPAILALVRALIETLGHVVIVAEDGVVALERFDAEAPDMVLSDVMMPRLDGFGLLKAIRERETERWVPVILITALDAGSGSGRSQAVDALNLGADDYISKPLQIDALRARVSAFARALALQESIEEQRAELLAYRLAAEEEKRFARELMTQLARTGQLSDPAVRFYCKPTEHLSGDIVALARTYSGKLHVLLADATGHGLTAALNVLPIVDPFYAMTSKGYSIQTILTELNSKLYSNLPPECYAAVGLMSFDSTTGALEVSNAGLPDIVMRDKNSGTVRRFKSSAPPLGIIPPAVFEIVPSCLNLPDDSMLALMSDGLVEVFGHYDLARGVQHVCDLMDEMPDPDALIKHIRETQCGSYADDLTIVLVECARSSKGLIKPGFWPEDHPPAATATPEVRCGTWKFELNLGPQELQRIDAVPLLHDFLRALGVGRKSTGQVFLVLSELLTNAIDHGLLQLSTESKNTGEDMEIYFDLRDARLQALQHGQVKIVVTPCETESGSALEVIVADSGAGFDHALTDDSRDSSAQSRGGRGLKLVREICQVLEFRGTGNVAVARLPLALDDDT